MTAVFFQHALLPDGFARNVRVTIGGGVITGITPNATPTPLEEHHAVGLPGMPNLHSHSFQRAMAGLAEYRSAGADNFWSWREQMYRFGLRMDPDDVEAVATLAFAEMLEAGFTSVAEFHYLHHDPAGKAYANIAEMATRIAAAAAATGIELLLLPVFYAHSNFGGLPPNAGQRRFICSLDEFWRLYEKCQALAPSGIAPHSLRAVTPEELSCLAAWGQGRPFHLHISEQTQEVEDCLAWSSARPVEWLLDHADVNQNWCLIHATHADADERANIARVGAVTGFCPITEANLGDGIFQMAGFGGSYGIGTDSNVLIDVAQELRQMEYAQRLQHRQRNVLVSSTQVATGTALYQAASTGGAKALGVTAGLRLGAAANMVSLNNPMFSGNSATPETMLNLAIFATRCSAIETVWVHGRKCVVRGQHINAATIRKNFNLTLEKLL